MASSTPKPVPGKPGQTLNAEGVARVEPRRGREGLPGELLVLAARGPGRRASSPARASTSTASRDVPDPGAVRRSAEAGLPAVPSARQRADARRRAHEALGLQDQPRGVGPPRQDRAARLGDGQHDAAPRARARSRCTRTGRTGSPPATLPPAPPRPNGVERNVVITHVGLGQLDLLHARRDHDVEAESARERERSGVGGRCRARQLW